MTLTKHANQRKLHYIGAMVRKLLLVHVGKATVDDRDSYANKRVDASGTLMSLLVGAAGPPGPRPLARADHAPLCTAAADASAVPQLPEDDQRESTPDGGLG